LKSAGGIAGRLALAGIIAAACVRNGVADYSGDGQADPAIYNEATGVWNIMSHSGETILTNVAFGGAGWSAVPGDFNGDGVDDMAVYRESTGEWEIRTVGAAAILSDIFGGTGKKPVQGDFDGDLRSDLALYDETTGAWEIRTVTGTNILSMSLGGSGWTALAADFDGDAYADPAVYQASGGNWKILLSSGAYVCVELTGLLGGTNWTALAADFDGDRHADPTVYSESDASWVMMMSSFSYLPTAISIGGPGQIPFVMGDFDGDGIVEPAVYEESSGTWCFMHSTTMWNTSAFITFGGPGNAPVENFNPMPPPTAPEAIYADCRTNAVYLSWPSSRLMAPIGSGYEVWRSASSDNVSSATRIGTTSGTGFEDTDVSYDCLYHYWVQATNPNRPSGFSGYTTAYRKLMPPQGVSAGDGAFSDRIRVIWNAVTGASGYNVWRTPTSDNVSATLIGATDSTSYDDFPDERNAAYYYWVQATNVFGQSDFSACDRGYSSAVNPLSPPTGVSAGDGTYADKVRVTWNTVSGATDYEVWRATTNSTSSAVKIGKTSGAVYDDFSAAPDMLYYYWIKAKSAEQTSGFSSPDSGFRAPTATSLSAPTSVSASDGAFAGKVRITWSAVSGASFYEVWRATTNESAFAVKLGNVAGTSHDDTAVTAGNTYYYWVKAGNLIAASAFSAPDSGYPAVTRASGSADLFADGMLFNPVVFRPGGHPELAMLLLRNNGPDDMNAGRVNVDFYLSRNFTFGDGDEQWIGDYAADVTLSAGNYTTLIVSDSGLSHITLPSDANGYYNVFARARHGGTLNDSDLDNNTVMRIGTIVVGENAGLKTPVSGDFDGNGLADLALYQEATGSWEIRLSGSGYGLIAVAGLGGAGIVPLAGDFDGDGKDDPAIYDESTGNWHFWKSGDNYAPSAVTMGGLGYKAVAGDFNGDGRTDVAVFRSASGYWLILPSENSEPILYRFGAEGYAPIIGDYDGDGLADLALYKQVAGAWMIMFSASDYAVASFSGFGGPGWTPVIADYDGDGKADPALYNERLGSLYIRISGADYAVIPLRNYGGPGWTPVLGDFDGDGLADFVLYQASTSTWKFMLSGSRYALISLIF